MASTHQLNRTLDVSGTHRYMFFTSSTGVNRTKKGRLLFSRRNVGRSSTIVGNCRTQANSDTTESDSSAVFLTTSTQTDMRDSEIQTDPWWHRSEGVPLLCCRGSHRKLERAKWNARVYLGPFEQQQEEDQDVIQQESLPEMQDSDASVGTRTPDTTLVKQKTVSCGPSYVSRACFPDPLDLWVSTYQKLRVDDEIEEEKMSLKKTRLRERQNLRNMKQHKQPTTELYKTSGKLTTYRMISNRGCRKTIPKLPPSIPKLDNAILGEALDHLCQQIQEQFKIRTTLSK
ncbi:uncharacterized protein LOC130693637 [Daphnia carinata]|uniref:uncharacterized protein LOC130693637 n=1 Tax=Daphnia carinata TaxID=120202 RepID=UPI00257B05C4|nr:uncharacterized protein LOC130693637 [Daphnia carinata]